MLATSIKIAKLRRYLRSATVKVSVGGTKKKSKVSTAIVAVMTAGNLPQRAALNKTGRIKSIEILTTPRKEVMGVMIKYIKLIIKIDAKYGVTEIVRRCWEVEP